MKKQTQKESEQEVFRPPDSFLKASQARQERLKEMRESRKNSQTSPMNSPEPTKFQTPAPQARKSVNPLPSVHEPVKPRTNVNDRVSAKNLTSNNSTKDENKKNQKSIPKNTEQFQSRSVIPSILEDKKSVPNQKQQQKIEVLSKIRNNVSAIQNANSNEGQQSLTKSPIGSPGVASKTHQGIEQIRKAREERRRVQAEVRQAKQEWEQTGADGEMIGYSFLIEEFRKFLCKQFPQDADDPEPAGDDDMNIVRVCVRKRPVNTRESSSQLDVISCRKGAKNYPNAQVFVHEPKTQLNMTKIVETHQFKFDHVFDETCDNEKVFKYAAQPLLKVMFTPGGRATFFAYGQTGSGKTHTIFGSRHSNEKGIYQHMCEQILDKLSTFNSLAEVPLILTLRFFEIYSGRIYDLFSRRSRVMMMESKDGHAHVAGLCEVQVSSLEEMLNWLDVGEKARTVGATEANPESSRSHAIFQITLRQLDISSEDISVNSIFGQFSLIDLAGSERASEANARDRQTRIEGGEINKSLLALKECIRALNDPYAKHVPFRASKLTQILRDSLMPSKNMRGADNRVAVMLTTISPNSDSVEHTLNTLRYADRAKEFSGGSGANGERILEPMVYDPVEMVHLQSRKNSTETEVLISPKDPVEETAKVIKNSAADGKKSKHENKSMPVGTSKNSSQQKQVKPVSDPVDRLNESKNTKNAQQKHQHQSLIDENNSTTVKPTIVSPPTDSHINPLLETPGDEETIVRLHVTCLQETLRISQLEESLLDSLELSEPGFENYMNGLDRAIDAKLNMYLSLRRRLDQYKYHNSNQ